MASPRGGSPVNDGFNGRRREAAGRRREAEEKEKKRSGRRDGARPGPLMHSLSLSLSFSLDFWFSLFASTAIEGDVFRVRGMKPRGTRPPKREQPYRYAKPDPFFRLDHRSLSRSLAEKPITLRVECKSAISSGEIALSVASRPTASPFLISPLNKKLNQGDGHCVAAHWVISTRPLSRQPGQRFPPPFS